MTFASDGKGRNGKLSASRVNLSPFPYGGRSLSLPPSLPRIFKIFVFETMEIIHVFFAFDFFYFWVTIDR